MTRMGAAAGCVGCGIAQHRPGPREAYYDPNPLAMLMGQWQRGLPGVGTVDSSVADVAPCCDACAAGRGPDVTVDVETQQNGGCATGACGVPTTAGIRLPLGRRAGEVHIATDPELEAYAAAWARETGLTGTGFTRQGGRVRRAGRVLPVTTRPFHASTTAELRALPLAELRSRRDALLGVDPDANGEVDTELSNVEAELDRRAGVEPGGDADYGELTRLSDTEICAQLRTATGAQRTALQAEQRLRDLTCTGAAPAPGGEETTAAEDVSDADWERKRRGIAEAAARELEPEDSARRAAIVTRALTGTFATFNQWLDENYRTRVEQIHGNTAITLAQIGADDRQREREYRLQMYPPGGSTSNPSGGGGVGEVLGLGAIIAAIAAVAR